jgi:hypothetical protein
MFMTRGSFLIMFALSVVLSGRLAAQTTGAGELNLKATSANVKAPGSPVSVRIVRWSTDQERDALNAALNPPPAAAAPARAAGGDARGAAAGPAAAGRGAPARGGRGAAGRGGRGDAPPNPIAALTTAIAKGPTIGYIWTSDVSGYSIKYAYRTPLPDGGERIVLATDRRLGAYTPGWKPAVEATPTDYEFTVLEIRLNAKGVGEGKTSLTTKVIVDDNNAVGGKTVALENYAAAPAILQNVRR